MSLPNLGFGSKTDHDQLGGTTYPRYMVMYAERKQTSDSTPNDEDPIFGFRGATTHTTGTDAKVYMGILNGVLPTPEHNITVSNLSAGIEIKTDSVIAKPGIIFNPQSAAGPAVNGSLYFDSDDGQLWLYSGGWTALTTGAGMTAHDLTGAYHTEDATGGAGNFLKADSATTFSWQAHGLSASDVGAYTTAQVDSAIDTDITTHAGLSDVHHTQNHALIDTTGHTVSGLTGGHFLKALTATTYGFQAHGLSASDVGAYTTGQTDSAIDADISTHAGLPNVHHSESHVLATTGPHTGTLPWTDLNKTGSSLADLATRTHASLSDAPSSAHHTRYADSEAVSAVQAANPLALTNSLTVGGDISASSLTFTSAVFGTYIPYQVANTGVAPVTMSQFQSLRRGVLQTLHPLTGEKDHFYLIDRQSAWTIGSTGGTPSGENNMFNNQLDSNCLITVADLPYVLTITHSGTITATDVLYLEILGHRLSAGAFTLKEWKVEVRETAGSVWWTVLDRSGVTDLPNIAVPLWITGMDGVAYKSIDGIRLTITSADGSSWAPLEIYLAKLALINTRPSGTPAEAIGALDIVGGTVYGNVAIIGGDLTAANIITAGNVDGVDVSSHAADGDIHVAHSGVTIIAGTGLSGGGTIAADRTINCDITQYTNAMALAHIVGQDPLALTNGLTVSGFNIEIDSADHATFIADAAAGSDARFFFRENGVFKGQLQYDSGNAFVSLENATSAESIRMHNAGGTVVSGNMTAANIITAGNVDGVDVSAFKTAYDTHNVADNHIAHSGVTITAGTGLSGGGTIAATRTINCDITQYTDALARTAVVSDDAYGAGWSGVTTYAASKNRIYEKINAMDTLIAANTTVAEVEAVITAELVDGQSIDNAIDSLINTHNVANRHIDHSGVSVTAGTGLSGGGTIAADRTINCDITQYTDALARTAVLDDGIYPTDWDADTTHAPSRNAVRDKIVLMDSDISGKTDQGEVEGIITQQCAAGQTIDNAIDALIDTHNVADNHIAHSGVTITAGTGLSGGGTIAASRTINCDITQYTDALVEAVIDAEIVGGQSIDNAIDALINTHNVANRHIDHSAVSITAGTGLSGGGTIAASRTINCDITQYTNALAVAAIVAENPLALTNAIKIGGNSIEDSTGSEMVGFNGVGFIDFLAGQGTPTDNDVLAWDTSTSRWVVQAQIGGGAGGDWFKTITGITNDVVADATDDTLTLATGNNILTIVGAAVTDTITFTIVEANINHDAIANVSANDHHNEAHTLASHSSKAHSELTSINYNDHHVQKAVPSFVPHLTNGAVFSTFHSQPIIHMPLNDNDCMCRFNLRVPDEWPTGHVTIKTMYTMPAIGAYSVKWVVTATEEGDNWVSAGKNVLADSTAYDFPTGTTNTVYVKTMALTDADIKPGCSLGVAFYSDALNTPDLYIMGIWIEP